MSKSCCFVKNCRGKKSVDRRLHMLPSNMVIRNIWLRNCNIASMVEVGNTVNNVKICSDHFEDHMYSKPENKKKLRRNAIPTLFNNSSKRCLNIYFTFCCTNLFNIHYQIIITLKTVDFSY